MRIRLRIESLKKGFRQNLGIIGSEGLGKSHLLREFLEFSKQDNTLLPIALSADALNFGHLAERWMGSLLQAYLTAKGQKFRDDLDMLTENAAGDLPLTTGKIQRIRRNLRKGDWGAPVARELFSLTGVLAQETGKKIILMIDEFDNLEYLPSTDPFAALGKEIMVQKETLFIVTSSRAEKSREIFQEKLSMLFGNFEVIDCVAMTYQESSHFLAQKQPGYHFSKEQTAFLVKMTDGVPAYLDLILDRLGICFPVSHHMQAEGASACDVPTERLMLAFETELFDRRGRLALIFEKRLQQCRRFAKDSRPYVEALLAISAGRRKLIAIASLMDRATRETKKILERLVQEELVSKRGSFYVIADGLFRFWLCEVYALRNRVFGFDEQDVRVRFSRALERHYEASNEQSNLNIQLRLEALLKEFRNDVIEIDGKSMRCPHFTEINFKLSGLPLSPLVARNAKVRWFCYVAEAPVREDDVAHILDDLKRQCRKSVRKILIALGGIDQNAKLLAQAAKVQLWSLTTFNLLLDSYNLPKLMLVKESHGSDLGAVAESLHTA